MQTKTGQGYALRALEEKDGTTAQRFQKLAFPNNPDKQIIFHDLRHSYAIHLLSIGMTMEDMARGIGDTMEVCEEFYAGFSHTSESASSMAERYLRRVETVKEAQSKKPLDELL
jgi:hypothetical protein